MQGFIIGIETSCDETAAAVLNLQGDLLSNVVHSQAEIHSQHGGIVPEIASRQHILKIGEVVKKALADSGCSWGDTKAVAVTYGPGLAGSLVIGVNFAKGLATALDVPLIGVNHLEAHAAAAWIQFPDELNHLLEEEHLIALIVSGGHTELTLMRSLLSFEILGETRDDAAGEAFDKIARSIGLGYPGGPAIQKAAQFAKNSRVDPLPRAQLSNSWDFSFSGLKTAALRRATNLGLLYSPGVTNPLGDHYTESADTEQTKQQREVVASFAKAVQDAIVDMLVHKTIEAAERYHCSGIVVAGGVAANHELRQRFKEESSLPVYIPDPVLCTDNGAMVAIRGLMLFREDKRHNMQLEAIPNLRITDAPNGNPI